MIISYLTESYFKWAEIFLESYRIFNDEKMPILLNTRDLNGEQVKRLKKIYGNLEVDNMRLDLEKIARQYGVTKQELIDSRDDITGGKLSGKHRLWMDVTSVCDRTFSFVKYVHTYPSKADCFVHFDIDVLFRNDIGWIFDTAKLFDVGLIIRGADVDPRIACGIVAINPNDRSLRFLEKWAREIAETPLYARIPLPYQQWACNKIFMGFRDYANFWRIPYGPGKSVDSKLGLMADIWTFKVKKKNESYIIAKLELERLLNAGR